MKRFTKLIGFIAVFIVAMSAFCMVSFAVTVGQPLTSPEAGWQRIDNKDSKIKYTGPWNSSAVTTNGNYWGGTAMYGSHLESNVRFKFYGTKLRIMSSRTFSFYNEIRITIDGVPAGTMNEYYSAGATYQTLLFEKTGLTLGVHEVVISAPESAPSLALGQTATLLMGLDSIDIDADGYLVKLDDVIGVGDKLFVPEDGWQRYDDRDNRIIYSGNQDLWTRWVDSTD